MTYFYIHWFYSWVCLISPTKSFFIPVTMLLISFFPLIGIIWLVATSLHCLPPSLHNLLYWVSSVCSNFSLLIRAPSVDWGPTQIQYDLILSWLSSKVLFPNEVSFTGIRGENFNISFGGIQFNLQYPGKGQKQLWGPYSQDTDPWCTPKT